MRLTELMEIFGLKFEVKYKLDNEDQPYDVLIPDVYILDTDSKSTSPLGTGITFDTAVSELIDQMNGNKRIIIRINGADRAFPVPLIESF